MDRLSPGEIARFEEANAAYRARFGFPFVICVREHDRHGILNAFERRLAHGGDEELAVALGEVGKIGALRLRERVTG